MSLKELNKDEIETISYDDLAYIILKDKKKKQTTLELFKKVCEIKNFDERVIEEKIADFFSLLLTDQRFIQLEKGYWDLKENHKIKINMEELDNDSEDEEEILDIQDEIEEDTDEDYLDDTKDADDDTEEDDLKDLVIVEEDTDEDI